MTGAVSVAVDGDYAYVASSGSMSLTVIDVSNKTSPEVVGWVTNPTSMRSAQALAIDHNYVYLVTYEGDLNVIDVSNKTDPSLVTFMTDDSHMNGASSVVGIGNYAIVASQLSSSATVVHLPPAP